MNVRCYGGIVGSAEVCFVPESTMPDSRSREANIGRISRPVDGSTDRPFEMLSDMPVKMLAGVFDCNQS